MREADEGAAVVEFKPAAFNSEREARRILCRCAPIDVQERAVELFDVEAAILHNLEGVRVLHQSACGDAGVTDFRFHDFRHTFASALLRQTGNLKLVQKALGHANIKTTTRYAHVLADEVGDAIEAMNQRRAERSAQTTGESSGETNAA